MANQRMPEDPYRFDPDLGDYNRRARFDRDGPLDRDFDSDPPSSGKITLFAVGIAIVLGAIFYGLNTTSLKNPPPTQSAQSEPTSPRAPPGMTTGAAPAQPALPPATAPGNMSRNPPANK